MTTHDASLWNSAGAAEGAAPRLPGIRTDYAAISGVVMIATRHAVIKVAESLIGCSESSTRFVVRRGGIECPLDEVRQMALQVKVLGPGFAAEVRGAGLADVAERDDAYAAVRAAFEEYSVLLFRGQPVSDDLQVAYSRRFGPLEIAKVASLGEGTPFSILTNIDRATGKLVPPDHKEALRARANQLWHTDSSYKETPALASV